MRLQCAEAPYHHSVVNAGINSSSTGDRTQSSCLLMGPAPFTSCVSPSPPPLAAQPLYQRVSNGLIMTSHLQLKGKGAVRLAVLSSRWFNQMIQLIESTPSVQPFSLQLQVIRHHQGVSCPCSNPPPPAHKPPPPRPPTGKSTEPEPCSKTADHQHKCYSVWMLTCGPPKPLKAVLLAMLVLQQ